MRKGNIEISFEEEKIEALKFFLAEKDTSLDEELQNLIKELYEKTGYVIDTHTAVAASVYKKYVADTQDTKPTVIASTASPYKFARSVMSAIDAKYEGMEDFDLIDELTKLSGVAEPNAIKEIRSAKVVHDTVCEVNEMKDVVKKFLGI